MAIWCKRIVGPGGSWLNRATAFLLATWMVHGLLRIALLFRPDAFGLPFVGKPDWYIFHAWFLDLHWIFLWSLPFLLALVLTARFWPRLCQPVFMALGAFHAVVLMCTVIDHETLRFMGMHFDPGMARTYGNTAAAREVLRFVASDASLPGLPYVLLLGCFPLAWGLYWLLSRESWVQSPTWSLGPVAWILGGCAVGYLYLYQIWPGGHRMAKLRPFVYSVVLSFQVKECAPLSTDSLRVMAKDYQKLWRSSGGDSDWVFPKPEYPYYREPKPRAKEAAIHGEPWNFVFFLLESHRALNVGHLRPFGSLASATPFLDSLALTGHFWTRAVASGIPTINALVALHLSIVEHPTRLISSDFTTLHHQAFTKVLANHGYLTHYFSAADPAWDNQTPWLRQWYQGFSYDRHREEDGKTLRHMSDWLRDSLPPNQPFFVTVMTKTNHYPFNPVDGVRGLPDSASLTERMSATMGYTDSCMRVFVDSLRHRSWFNHTLLIVMADHGFPLSEHGSSAIGYGLYTESVWLPLVISGDHPKLGRPQEHDALAAQIDLGPTILDLAGIRDPNSYMGHSLLTPVSLNRQFVFLPRGEQAMVERGPYRWHGPWGRTPREQGNELFNLIEDRGEHHNIWSQNRSLADSLGAMVPELTRLYLYVVEQNRLWPENL